MTYPISQFVNTVASGGTSTSPFITVLTDRNPTTSDTGFPVSKRWVNTSTGLEFILSEFTSSQGVMQANWTAITSPIAVQTVTGNSGGAIDPDNNGNINIVGDGTTITIAGNSGTNTLTASLVGATTAIDSISPDSGTDPVVPTGAGLVSVRGSGSTTTVGGTNLLTVQLTGLTQYSVLVGSGGTTITKVAPNVTSGVPLISQGAAADPTFGTAVVAGGGTGATSFTANGILYGNTTSAIQVTASANNSVLLTNGSGVPSLGVSLNNSFLFTSSTAGAARYIQIENTDNTNNGSHAKILVTSGGTSGGDPYCTYAVGSSRGYGMGVDVGASGQPFSIGTAAGSDVRPSVGKILNLTSAGELTLPLQPAFFAYLASTATNKTGNGATYTLGTDALTEVFDQGGDFNTNGTFTAPVTGIYSFDAKIAVTGATVATTFVLSLVVAGTSARTYQNTIIRAASANDQSISISTLASMTATDTATCTITVTGEAGDTDDILGSATAVTYFCGHLAC